jgi:hypothetical protein
MSGYAKRMMQIAEAWIRANPEPHLPLRLPPMGRSREDIAKDIANADQALSKARLTNNEAIVRQVEEIRAALLKIQQDGNLDRLREEVTDLLNKRHHLSQGSILHLADRLTTNDDPLIDSPESSWLIAWARDGYNVFDLSSDFTAAMLLTDQRQIDLSSLRLPFRGILFTIPDQFAIGAEGTSYTKIHVFELEDSESPEERAETTADTAPRVPRPAIGIYTVSGPHLLATIVPRDELSWDKIEDLPDNVEIDADREACKTIQRVIFGALAYATMVDRAIVERSPGPPKKKHAPHQPSIRHWTIGSTIKIDPELVRAARRGAREVAIRIKRRFIVRGHYRDQAHGPRRSLRTSRWIAPFYKGPTDGAILVHTYEPSTPDMDLTEAKQPKDGKDRR